jgi:hypothetical protein
MRHCAHHHVQVLESSRRLLHLRARTAADISIVRVASEEAEAQHQAAEEAQGNVLRAALLAEAEASATGNAAIAARWGALEGIQVRVRTCQGRAWGLGVLPLAQSTVKSTWCFAVRGGGQGEGFACQGVHVCKANPIIGHEPQQTQGSHAVRTCTPLTPGPPLHRGPSPLSPSGMLARASGSVLHCAVLTAPRVHARPHH